MSIWANQLTGLSFSNFLRKYILWEQWMHASVDLDIICHAACVCACSPMCPWYVIITLGLSLTKWEIEKGRLGNSDAINLFSFTVILFIVLTKWHIIEFSLTHTPRIHRDERHTFYYVWQRFTHRPHCECCRAIHFHHEFIRNLNALPYDLLFFRSFDTFRRAREVLA